MKVGAYKRNAPCGASGRRCYRRRGYNMSIADEGLRVKPDRTGR
jgi:hypothetical protein